MKYKRKTINRSTAYAYLGTIVLIFLLTLSYLGKNSRRTFLTPLSSIQVVREVRAVEVPVYPETIEEMICAKFPDNCRQAIKVAWCESRLNPKAANKTSSARGLFQIMQSWHKIDQKWLFEPEINIAVASKLYDEQGWNPWNASKHCWGE